jgi:curved DNA-binding protein
MKFVDYYKVLGIGRTASREEIKQAYYKLARKYHPDLNIFNEVSLKKFCLINEAYDVLGDLDKRLRYKIKLEQYDDYIDEIQREKIRNGQNAQPKNKGKRK